MLIFLQATFISFVILYRSNIWVALVPNPLFVILVIGACILLLSVIAPRAFLVRYPNHIILLSILSLLIMLTTQFVTERGVTQIVGYLLASSLAVITISLWKTKQEIRAIKIFIIFCTIICLLGFVAWLIVNFSFLFQGYIDPTHIIDLEEFTGGRMKRGYFGKTNVFEIDMDYYSFPYSLGLVLTGGYAYDLFGVPFFRASGIFHEPSNTAFVTIPTLVLTFNSIYFSKKWQRRTLLSIQFCFLAASMSLSIIFSLLSIFILYNILILFVMNLSRVNLIKVFCFTVIISGICLLGVYSFNIPGIRGITKNILFSKLTCNDYLSISLGVIFNPKYFFNYSYFFAVSLSCAFIAAKKNNKSLMSFSLIVICLLIMSLKGFFHHLLISPGFFVLFFLMLKNIGKSTFLPTRIRLSKRDISQHS